MVGFGQTICLPLGPLCNNCLNKDICPSSGKLNRSPSKKSPIKKSCQEDVKSDVTKLNLQLKEEPVQSPDNVKSESLGVSSSLVNKVQTNVQIENESASQNILQLSKSNNQTCHNDVGLENVVQLRRKSPRNKNNTNETNMHKAAHCKIHLEAKKKKSSIT
ncbi:unnamed protein product [Parnassius mnemosyne]